MFQKNRRWILFLIVSLGLHILVGLAFLFNKSEREIPKQTIEFEVVPAQKTAKSAGPAGPRQQQSGHSSVSRGSESQEKKAAENILIEGSKVRLDKAGSDVAGETVFGDGPSARSGKGSGAWVEQISIEKGMELTAFLQRLQERIDRALDYPEDMAVQRIRGDVRLDFYVDRKGRLQGDFHKVRGAETLLNLYVMSSLLVILKEPLPENLWAKEDKIPISIHVQFSTYEFTESQMRNEAFFQANELNFTRARYVTPLAVSKLEKIFTRYIPPIIPIPGGFYVDVVMLTKYIQNINTPDPDDKRKARLGLTREHLELATKKKADIFE